MPKAVITVTPGRGSSGSTIVWDGDTVILLDAETMAKGPQGVLHWLLHLAAHSIADTRQEPARGRVGPSTGREGRYHLQAYRTRLSASA